VHKGDDDDDDNNSAHDLNVKAEVIPVTTGKTGPISKSLRQYPSNITGKHEIKELQNPYCALHTNCGKC